jgi:hypothetical protein
MITGTFFLIKDRKPGSPDKVSFLLFLMLLLNGLIISVYLLKKFCGVGYPEDRTALVFYLLFIMNCAFVFDKIDPKLSRSITGIVSMGFAIHYIQNVNISRHSLWMYDVIPQKYYNHLLDEQKQHADKITIGGSDFFEPIYGFINYKHQGALNYMDYPDTMRMNVDYCITAKSARRYYSQYYQEIDSNNENEYVLVKRKWPLVRKPICTVENQHLEMDSAKAYFNFFELRDTVFSNLDPLLVELNFKVLSGDMPAFSWLVLSIDTAESKTVYYRRIPLNRIKRNWSDENSTGDLILETEALPKQIHRLVCYLWNAKRQQVNIKVNSTKVFQLQGLGADASASVVQNVTSK